MVISTQGSTLQSFNSSTIQPFNNSIFHQLNNSTIQPYQLFHVHKNCIRLHSEKYIYHVSHQTYFARKLTMTTHEMSRYASHSQPFQTLPVSRFVKTPKIAKHCTLQQNCPIWHKVTLDQGEYFFLGHTLWRLVKCLNLHNLCKLVPISSAGTLFDIESFETLVYHIYSLGTIII